MSAAKNGVNSSVIFFQVNHWGHFDPFSHSPETFNKLCSLQGHAKLCGQV